MKVVVNRCYGGFGLSTEATLRYYKEKFGGDLYPYHGGCTVGGVPHVRLMPPYKAANIMVHFSKEDLGDVIVDIPNRSYYSCRPERNDPVLVRIVEEMREAASGECADLEIVEIPDDVEWEVHDYDGMESIHEKHRSW